MAQPLRIAFSTCPNDTFTLGAMVNGWLHSSPISWEVTLADIQELNELALTDAFDVIKTSYFAYARLRNRYTLLNAGSALGFGVGPLLLAREPISFAGLAQCRVAIPGSHTTAHLLLHHYAPHVREKPVMRFDEIMPALQHGEVEAGVVIHEGRFTYRDYGLHLVADLGAVWEERQQAPIPLGCILAHNRLDASIRQQIETDIRASIQLARQQPDAVMPYIKAHANELSPEVIQAHIDLYVNDFSLSLGTVGHQAVDQFLRVAETLMTEVK